jgi:hypothetical protein
MSSSKVPKQQWMYYPDDAEPIFAYGHDINGDSVIIMTPETYEALTQIVEPGSLHIKETKPLKLPKGRVTHS